MPEYTGAKILKKENAARNSTNLILIFVLNDLSVIKNFDHIRSCNDLVFFVDCSSKESCNKSTIS